MTKLLVFLLAAMTLVSTMAFARDEDRTLEYRLLGRQLQEAGEYEKALQYFKKASRLDLSDAASQNDVGAIYEKLGRLKEAEAAYKEALKRDPAYAPVHANMARLYEKTGRKTLALNAWRQRAKLGQKSDPWRQEAERRAQKLTQMARQADSESSQPLMAEELAMQMVSERQR